MKPLPLLIILLILDHIAFSGSRVSVSLDAISLHASPFTIGLLIALHALLPALLSVTAGRWIDRIGIVRPMLIGSTGVGVGIVLPFFFSGLPVLFATALMSGVAFMLINISAYHAVGEWSAPEERPVNFSYISLGFSTSTFIGPLIAGIFIDQLGFAAAFLLLALFTVLPIIAISAKLLPTHRPHRPEVPVEIDHVFALLRTREMRRLFTVMTMLTLAWDVYGFAIPIYGSSIGLSATNIGTVMGSFAAATFAVRMALPFVVQHLRPWTILSTALLLAGGSFIAIGFTSTLPMLMVVMFSLGLGLGSPQPMVLTLLHQSAPAGRAAEALGLRTTLINTSQTVMPLAFGAAGAALGITPIFWFIALLLLSGSVFTRRWHH
ncbi:MAG: MFS transporter [Betaproteobacteria bacterium]|nr:MFS transporter [Betaproteobacteria bacterium]